MNNIKIHMHLITILLVSSVSAYLTVYFIANHALEKVCAKHHGEAVKFTGFSDWGCYKDGVKLQ